MEGLFVVRIFGACLPILVVSNTVYAAAEITVRIPNTPQEGMLVLQVYDDPNAFGDFRRPATEQRYNLSEPEEEIFVVRGVPEGDIAVLAYVDENGNGALDRSFIGIPKEPIGLSNNYRPKGPPSFQRASVSVKAGASSTLDIELYEVLGETGQWGVGLGVIGRSSPYTASDATVTQVIPAITYFGERLQWVGPQLRYGLLGSDTLRLALTATYRVGAYEEDDSPVLEGLGDRDSTLLAGVGVVYEGPAGIDLDFRYQHDVLDRVGGGTAQATLSKGFQAGNWRFSPFVGVNWLSSDLADYDFGVPMDAALPGRPAYSVGSSTNFEVGVGSLWEITQDWRVVLNLGVEKLDSEITGSPIVEEDYVIQGFAAITYTF